MAAPLRACTTVLIPEMAVTVKSTEGQILAYGPQYLPWNPSKSSPSTEELQKFPVLAVPTGKAHMYNVYVTRRWYKSAVVRNVVVEWLPDGCHPITKQLTVVLKRQMNAPAIREFRLTGMGRPFGIFLDADAAVKRQGVRWSSSRPDIAPVDAKTGTMTPKCLNERAWTRITATLKADPRYKASATMSIGSQMRGCVAQP